MTNLAMLLLALGRETTAAVEWLEQASDAGDPLAMAVLAGQLMKSDPAPETLVRARSLLERAVRAGHKASYHTLGYMIAGGLGGAQDLDAGLRLIGEAAARGSAAAAVVLAFLQAATRSWPVSETALEGLRQLGWSGFHIETLVRLASAYREREAAKVAEPVRLDDARSLFERGVHLSQEAKPPDYRGAHECYAGAAALGYPEAMYNLAYLYLNGEGVDRDVPTGLDWMRRAAESGKPHMQYNLAVLLNEGILAEPDREQAVHWYRRAADQGYPQALHNLAWCYLQGTGVGRDPDAALALFRRAAASGLPESVSMVAKLA
jgi:TPR repeat protein